MAQTTRSWQTWVSGVGVTIAAGAIGTAIILSGPPDKILNCEDYDDEANTIDCVEVDDPRAGTTSSTAPTTTTTLPDGYPSVPPFPDIESEFDISTSGPYRSVTSTGTPATNFPDVSNEPSGNFRVVCEPSHLGYYDPILAPGSSNFKHLHQFFGNTEVSPDSSYYSLRTTGDSSCSGGPLNRTAYWFPALMTGDGDVVMPDFHLIYYKGESTGNASLSEAQSRIQSTVNYPNGFRYLGGTNPVSATEYDTHEWTCMPSGTVHTTSTIPDSCPPSDTQIRGTVSFPHCWDGENLWLPDNAHVSNGVSPYGGPVWSCADDESHPVRLPSLTEFSYYSISSGEDMSDWYLSSDRMDPNPANWWGDGDSLHADWFGGWDNEIQQLWTENCIRGMRDSNNQLCDGTELNGGVDYSGPLRIPGWTPMHPIYGESGWPTGMGP